MNAPEICFATRSAVRQQSLQDIEEQLEKAEQQVDALKKRYMEVLEKEFPIIYGVERPVPQGCWPERLPYLYRDRKGAETLASQSARRRVVLIETRTIPFEVLRDQLE